MKAVLPLCGVAVFAWLVLLAHLVAGDPKPIALKVRPMIAVGATDVYLQVRVHPEPDDRWIVVAMDSGSFRRVSDWTLEPCQPQYATCRDRTLYSFWWTNVPAGQYELVARIGHGSTVRASDRLTLQYGSIEP